jgi:hypothetical protein
MYNLLFNFRTTYFSMISVLKSILTGNKQGLMINNDKNIEKSSQ